MQEEFELRVAAEKEICQSFSSDNRFDKFLKSDELFLKMCHSDQEKYVQLQGMYIKSTSTVQ